MRRPPLADGKPITDEEDAFAAACLDAFNRLTGADFALTKGTRTSLVLRHRERPALPVESHEAAIRALLSGRPFWEPGRPEPRHVWGNADQFQRCLNDARPVGAANGADGPFARFRKVQAA